MSNFGMTIDDVGACVRLIDVMTRNLPALGIERSHFDAILIETDKPAVVRRRLGEAPEPAGPGRRRYTLLLSGISDTAMADLERLAGTKLRELSEEMPAGQAISINELLESVLLVREPRPAAANGLILAVLGTDPDHVNLARWHAELSRLGCRGIRIGCVATEGDDVRVLYLIEIARPPPNFVPPAEWEANRVLVFYRLSPEASCPFYIEWGYAHPVRELPRLYQIGDERLVLMAVDALEQRRGQAGQPQTRVSLKLRLNDWHNIFEMPDQAEYAIELATELELRDLEAAQRAMNVNVAVEVRSLPAIGNSATEIEYKIAGHQQAIEELHRARQHREVERQEPVYLVKVFEQEASDQGPSDGARALPSGFVRFLDRPYAQLAGFQYGFFEDPFNSARCLHVVLDTRPGGYERIVSDMASDTYVCPQRWWDLGVRLFVRAGDMLHPYIEDDRLLLQLRDELWTRGGFDPEHPVLLRRDTGSAGSAQAICLSQLCLLLDPGVFQLLSTRFDVRVAEFHSGTRYDMIEAQRESARTLWDLAATLESGVEKSIADRVDLIEAEWKNADGRMHETETRLTGHLGSIAEIKALLDRHSLSWEAFVQNVLDADRSLSHQKVEALGKYEEANEKHAKAIQLLERALTDVNARLESDQREIAARREIIRAEEVRLARLERDLPMAVAGLDKLVGQLGARMDALSAPQRQRLDEERAKVAALVEKQAEMRQMSKTAEEERSRAEKLRLAERKAIEELRLFRERFDSEDKAWLADKATLMTPLDDEFLMWLEAEIRNRVEGRDRGVPKVLKWLTKEILWRRQR